MLMRLLLQVSVHIGAIGTGIAGAVALTTFSGANETSTVAISASSNDVMPARRTDVIPMRFSRPFIIPVTDGWRTRSLVVVSLNVELPAAVADRVPSLEERLRDRITTSFLALSHSGGLNGPITSPEVKEGIREAANNAVNELLPDMPAEVLIVDIMQRTL